MQVFYLVVGFCFTGRVGFFLFCCGGACGEGGNGGVVVVQSHFVPNQTFAELSKVELKF